MSKPQITLEQLQREMENTKAVLVKLSSAVEKRNERLANKSTDATTINQINIGSSPSIPHPNVGPKEHKNVEVDVDKRESTIMKMRSDGWNFMHATEMPMDRVKLTFWRKIDNPNVDGIDKSSYAEIAKTVRANHPNSSPALIQQKVDQAVNVYKTTGVLPKSSTQPKMGDAKSVNVPIDQRDATVESYRKDNWRYLSEKQNTDTGITQIRFEKM